MTADARLREDICAVARSTLSDADPEATVRGLAGKRSAVMLANHGPVVAGKDLAAACDAIEEREATARLALMPRGLPAWMLSPDQQRAVVTAFDVEWAP